MADTSLWAASQAVRPSPGRDPAGDGEQVPLSFQQDFLRMVDKGDDAGPFGPQYTIVGGWRVEGEIDLEVLREALGDVVARHEALHMAVVRDGDDHYQRLDPVAPPDLLVRDLPDIPAGERDQVAEEFLNEIEAGPFAIGRRPNLWAVLGRFDERDALLVLVAHHTLVDGWSIHVVLRDLAVLYAARRERRAPDLPKARQYREYVAWQRANAAGAATAAAQRFWRENLGGARLVPLRTDRPRGDDAHGRSATAWYRFLIDAETESRVLALAAETRSTPFMVLMSVYLRYLRELTGTDDLVLPTFTPGRRPSWVQETVGSFYNFVPLRTGLAGCADHRELIARVRASCLAAYAHELPSVQIMSEAPDLMDSVADPRTAACVFQVTQSPHMLYGERIGDLRYTALRRRLLSAPVGSEIPDGVLWGLELHPAGGGLIGSIGYTTDLFDESTIVEMVERFKRTLDAALAD